MHQTAGTLRVFKYSVWLGVDSAKMALSHPAHQPVTQAVGRRSHSAPCRNNEALNTEARMETFPKKHIIILVIAVIAYSLIFMILVQLLDESLSEKDFLSPGSLLFWKVVAVIFIVYGFARLWFWPQRLLKRIAALPPRSGASLRPISPKTGVLLLCYVVLVFPNLYGLLLFFRGMPIAEFYYFMGASIAGGIVWGFYHIQKS